MKKEINVAHDFKYHCEIQYETLHAFNFTKAVGRNISELITDVKEIMYKYKDRDPKIIEALYDPNGRCIKITSKVILILKMYPNKL